MVERDCVMRIQDFNAGRDAERLQLKYRAMQSSPFSFLRGSCHLFYQDWPADSVLNNAPLAWISGDLHLENFGSFRGDNRLTYFDLNDFDEAVLAPATWELARFLTSVLVAADTLKLNQPEALALCHCFLDAYSAALLDGKARWIERSTADGMVKDLLAGLKNRSQLEYLNSRTRMVRGKRMLKIDGRHALLADDADYQKVTLFMAEFAKEQADPGFFKVLDVARRVAGTGSLGIERYVVLVRGNGSPDRNCLLDLKHQPGSALQPYVPTPQPEWENEAERVVQIQQRVQAIAPAFLSAVMIDDRAYTLRELIPSQDRLRLELWNGKLRRLEKVMLAMGRLVAWGQLRSGGRQSSATTDEYMEFAAQEDWREPLLAYARQYSRQVQADWQAFKAAQPQTA